MKLKFNIKYRLTLSFGIHEEKLCQHDLKNCQLKENLRILYIKYFQRYYLKII